MALFLEVEVVPDVGRQYKQAPLLKAAGDSVKFAERVIDLMEWALFLGQRTYPVRARIWPCWSGNRPLDARRAYYAEEGTMFLWGHIQSRNPN